MPSSSTVPTIPVATPQNLVTVVNALRTWVIGSSNLDAGRANAQGTIPPSPAGVMPSPSQFSVVQEVWASVTYTTSDGKTVSVPTLRQLTLKNPVTGETWTWTPAGKSTTGGVVGKAL